MYPFPEMLTTSCCTNTERCFIGECAIACAVTLKRFVFTWGDLKFTRDRHGGPASFFIAIGLPQGCADARFGNSAHVCYVDSVLVLVQNFMDQVASDVAASADELLLDRLAKAWAEHQQTMMMVPTLTTQTSQLLCSLCYWQSFIWGLLLRGSWFVAVPQ